MKALQETPSVTELALDSLFNLNNRGRTFFFHILFAFYAELRLPSVEFGTIIGAALKVPTCSFVSLSVENSNFTSDGVREIARCLCSNTVLKTLTFSHNGIGNLGAKHLGQMLSRNTTLTQSSLSRLCQTLSFSFSCVVFC